MTSEEATKMLEYIRYTGNGESEYKKCAQSIALDMAIKALEQLSKIEDIIDIDDMYIQEDVLKYKAICKVIKGEINV
jgi:hypothetical protein